MLRAVFAAARSGRIPAGGLRPFAGRAVVIMALRLNGGRGDYNEHGTHGLGTGRTVLRQ